MKKRVRHYSVEVISDLFYRLAYAPGNHPRIRQIITPNPAKIMILASAIIAPRDKQSELISDVSPKIPRSGSSYKLSSLYDDDFSGPAVQ